MADACAERAGRPGQHRRNSADHLAYSIGLIPLVPFIFVYFIYFDLSDSIYTIDNVFFYSILFTAISFFSIGLVKGKVVNKSPVRSGLNTLMMGGIAAVVAFLVGSLLGAYVK